MRVCKTCVHSSQFIRHYMKSHRPPHFKEIKCWLDFFDWLSQVDSAVEEFGERTMYNCQRYPEWTAQHGDHTCGEYKPR